MKNPRSILITGGSSGIGEALLMHYAAPSVTLSFNGRDRERISSVAEKLKSKGARVLEEVLDVTDQPGMEAWIREVDDLAPLDLVIANAGIGTSTRSGLTIDQRVKNVFDINVYGVFNTVHPALERMIARKRGQIAIMSSLAGFTGLPNSPSYAATKAAVKSYGRGLRSRYAEEGIKVTVICPGVVHTNMTESFYRRVPGWLHVDTAVEIIVRGLERNSGLIPFPWYTYWLIRMISSWPESWQDRAFRMYMKRRGDEPETIGV